MQNDLAKTGFYDDKELFTEKTTCAELRYSKTPIVIRATYRPKIKDIEIDELILLLQYSDNLKLIVERITFCTGANKVDIIAHSMGGIISRHYIDSNFENSKVRKLIMLATPNNGGLYNVGEIANKLAELDMDLNSLDFVALSENSDLSRNFTTPIDVQLYTIAGIIDKKGDGIVEAESVHLKNSKQYNVPCEHMVIKQPMLCPEAYIIIEDILLDKEI